VATFLPPHPTLFPRSSTSTRSQGYELPRLGFQPVNFPLSSFFFRDLALFPTSTVCDESSFITGRSVHVVNPLSPLFSLSVVELQSADKLRSFCKFSSASTSFFPFCSPLLHPGTAGAGTSAFISAAFRVWPFCLAGDPLRHLRSPPLLFFFDGTCTSGLRRVVFAVRTGRLSFPFLLPVVSRFIPQLALDTSRVDRSQHLTFDTLFTPFDCFFPPLCHSPASLFISWQGVLGALSPESRR